MIDSGNGGLYYLKQLNQYKHQYILVMDKAFFPYGEKSKEFLLKRSLYLCIFLKTKKVDKIVLACNTLSLIALPFLRLFFDNIQGVFYDFLPYIKENSAILGSKKTIQLLKDLYPNHLLLDGSALIEQIEHKKNMEEEIKRINRQIQGKYNLILACTHFLKLENDVFSIPVIKNKTD